MKRSIVSIGIWIAALGLAPALVAGCGDNNSSERSESVGTATFALTGTSTTGKVYRLRDGIYVLRVDDALVVKRLALNPMGRRVTVQSDNPAYPDWPDCGLDEINCIGRVIWSGRKIV